MDFMRTRQYKHALFKQWVYLTIKYILKTRRATLKDGLDIKSNSIWQMKIYWPMHFQRNWFHQQIKTANITVINNNGLWMIWKRLKLSAIRTP
jgi:hypothetical protein